KCIEDLASVLAEARRDAVAPAGGAHTERRTGLDEGAARFGLLNLSEESAVEKLLVLEEVRDGRDRTHHEAAALAVLVQRHLRVALEERGDLLVEWVDACGRRRIPSDDGEATPLLGVPGRTRALVGHPL